MIVNIIRILKLSLGLWKYTEAYEYIPLEVRIWSQFCLTIKRTNSTASRAAKPTSTAQQENNFILCAPIKIEADIGIAEVDDAQKRTQNITVLLRVQLNHTCMSMLGFGKKYHNILFSL